MKINVKVSYVEIIKIFHMSFIGTISKIKIRVPKVFKNCIEI